MGFRFLIDEQLSPRLVGIAHERGHEATCVRDRGWVGLRDDVLVHMAFAHDFVLVTRNVRDFRELLGTVEVHCGLISLHAVDDSFDVDTQLDFFEAALLALEGRPDLMNLELEVVERDDGSFDAVFRPLP